jgi:hypothetical protein
MKTRKQENKIVAEFTESEIIIISSMAMIGAAAVMGKEIDIFVDVLKKEGKDSLYLYIIQQLSDEISEII